MFIEIIIFIVVTNILFVILLLNYMINIHDKDMIVIKIIIVSAINIGIHIFNTYFCISTRYQIA